ncbi:hypothetical protein EVAR_33030_1 [Eumeta japonica]|uniref:Uncharacterized protein n=1 Tax=Eumeta variegata TaxID=151549 RepID=A0A4C1VSF5_EUMVA|nr:hypothetical protein EVAR_33030_1 [Eumeta japonica]
MRYLLRPAFAKHRGYNLRALRTSSGCYTAFFPGLTRLQTTANRYNLQSVRNLGRSTHHNVGVSLECEAVCCRVVLPLAFTNNAVSVCSSCREDWKWDQNYIPNKCLYSVTDLAPPVKYELELTPGSCLAADSARKRGGFIARCTRRSMLTSEAVPETSEYRDSKRGSERRRRVRLGGMNYLCLFVCKL